MKMDGDAIKVQLYRDRWKRLTQQTDRDFDRLIKSYPSAQQALLYLKGRCGTSE